LPPGAISEYWVLVFWCILEIGELICIIWSRNFEEFGIYGGFANVG